MISILQDHFRRKGGVDRLDPISKEFGELIEILQLVDIPTINGVFTWNNHRGERN